MGVGVGVSTGVGVGVGIGVGVIVSDGDADVKSAPHFGHVFKQSFLLLLLLLLLLLFSLNDGVGVLTPDIRVAISICAKRKVSQQRVLLLFPDSLRAIPH